MQSLSTVRVSYCRFHFLGFSSLHLVSVEDLHNAEAIKHSHSHREGGGHGGIPEGGVGTRDVEVGLSARVHVRCVCVCMAVLDCACIWCVRCVCSVSVACVCSTGT